MSLSTPSNLVDEPAGGSAGARDRSKSRGQLLLFCGALAGIGLTAIDVLRPPAPEARSETSSEAQKQPDVLAPGAVARVNGRLITEADFRQVLALEVASGAAADASLKRRVLDRMIDEELRVQRAIELKLHLSDPRARMDLASLIAEAATSSVERQALDETILREYFEKRRPYFAKCGALHVRQIWIGIMAGNLGEAYGRAQAASRLLRKGESMETVLEVVVGTSAPRPIPDKLIQPDQLAQYLDRRALHTALTMRPGEVSDPIPTPEGFHVLALVARQQNARVSFEGIRLDVEAEFWSERARAALDANAAELRRTAQILKASTL